MLKFYSRFYSPRKALKIPLEKPSVKRKLKVPFISHPPSHHLVSPFISSPLQSHLKSTLQSLLKLDSEKLSPIDKLLILSSPEKGANDFLSSLVLDLSKQINAQYRMISLEHFHIFPGNFTQLTLESTSTDRNEGATDDEDDVADELDDIISQFNKKGMMIQLEKGSDGNDSTVISFGDSSKGYKKQIEKYESVFRCLIEQKEETPIIYHIQDLHAFSNSKYYLLEALRRVTQKNIVDMKNLTFVCSLTPELNERDMKFPDFLNQYHHIFIPPLDSKHSHYQQWQEWMQKGKENRIRNQNLGLLRLICDSLDVFYNSNEIHKLPFLKEKLLPQRKLKQMILSAHGKSKDQSIGAAALEEAFSNLNAYKAETEKFTKLKEQPMSPIDRLKAKNIQFDSFEKKLTSCIVVPEMIPIGFKDIACLEKTKETLQTLISLPLLRPHLFKTGVLKDSISGILLFGPPGTGKTMLVKAIAKECGSNFLNVTASTLFNKYVGETEKMVRAVFSLARKLSPCVVFLDEVDSLFDSRDHHASFSSKRDMMNEFMAEWDGLTSKNDNIIIIGATNRPFDLDDAILRRMPRRILVNLPTLEEREAILRLKLKEEQLADDVFIRQIAEKTTYYSGSDLKNLCISAAMNAVKEDLMKDQQTKTLLDQNGKLSLGAQGDQTVRIIQGRHFDTALKEISASLNEKQHSIEKLKQWDEMYGEGSKASPKKKFGF